MGNCVNNISLFIFKVNLKYLKMIQATAILSLLGTEELLI